MLLLNAGIAAPPSTPDGTGASVAILADLRRALERADISVVLTNEITTEESVRLQREIASLPEVRESAYLSAQDAWTRVKEQLPSGVVSRIKQNPLPASIEVDIVSPERVGVVAVRIERLPGVKRVIYGQALARAVIDAVQDNLALRGSHFDPGVVRAFRRALAGILERSTCATTPSTTAPSP